MSVVYGFSNDVGAYLLAKYGLVLVKFTFKLGLVVERVKNWHRTFHLFRI